MVLFEFLIHLSPQIPISLLPSGSQLASFSMQIVSWQTCCDIRCLHWYTGWNWQEVRCLLKLLAAFLVWRFHKTVSFYETLIQKFIFVFALCFRTLINWYCQQLQKATRWKLYLRKTYENYFQNCLLIFLLFGKVDHERMRPSKSFDEATKPSCF